MMVEAEATDGHPRPGRGRRRRADRGDRRRRAWRRPSRSSRCSARPQAELADAAPPSRPREFPVFLDYQDDVLAAVEAAVASRARRGPHHRGQAGARGRARPGQGARRRDGSRRRSRAARRRWARRYRSVTGRWCASACCATRSASTAVALMRHAAPCRPRSSVLPRCTARRCLSGARPSPGRHDARHAPHGAGARHARPETRQRYMHNYNSPRRTRAVRPAGWGRRPVDAADQSEMAVAVAGSTTVTHIDSRVVRVAPGLRERHRTAKPGRRQVLVPTMVTPSTAG